MRYLRIFAVAIFAVCLLLSVWANFRYHGNRNADFPVITSEQEILEIRVEEHTDEMLLSGLTAHDKTDGNLTDRITIVGVSHFLEPGVVSVKYVVFDSHNNATSFSRKVRYTDYQPPRFSMKEAPVYTVGENFDLLSRIQASDLLDGDISDRIRIISGAVSNYTAGTYPVVLEVSNSHGDVQRLELTVTYVEEKGNADIRLTDHIVYLKVGEEFNPEDYVESMTDDEGNKLSMRRVTVKGNLDTETPGFYHMTYEYSYRDITGQTGLTVIVTEEVAS